MTDGINRSNESANYLRRVKRVLFSSTLIGSIIMSGNLVSASELIESQSSQVAVANADVKYNDYKTGQYWSQDMLWAIDKGLIQGYLNTTHPTNKNIKIKGNWLNPYGDLSEAQMLSVIFRYTHPDELSNITPAKDWWAAPAYQLADKYGVPIVGSANNQSKANGVVTRGGLARALATIHFGKEVSLQDSVNFMYEASLSYGKDASKGNTYENFGVKDKLVRAHIVSFVKRYDDFLKSGGKVTQPETPSSSLIAPSENNKVGNITVKYGSHTYASKNQAEYDKVMSIVSAKIKSDYDGAEFTRDSTNKYYYEYLDGARGIKDRRDPNFGTQRNSTLIAADSLLGDLVDAGFSKETIIELHKGSIVATYLLAGKTDPKDGSPSSAYDALVNGLSDCDPIAQVYSAVFDSLGYNTVMLTRPGHAFALVQIDGKWVDVTGGANEVVDVHSMLSSGLSVHVQPTFGGTLN